MHIADHEIVYRQLHRVANDEQSVSMDLVYDYIGTYQFIITVVILFFNNLFVTQINMILDYYNWYYDFKFIIVSPGVFHLLAHDDQDLLMYDSSVKLNDFSLDLDHALNIYAHEALSASYELKYFINDEQSGEA